MKYFQTMSIESAWIYLLSPSQERSFSMIQCRGANLFFGFLFNYSSIKYFSLLFSLQGDLVYVNYARTEDFFKLEREMGINCTGKIVIARYGKIFRGNKVLLFIFLEGRR